MTDARLGERAQGYLAEVGYVQGYYPGLNPLGMRFELLSAGLRPPRVETACELGFGQGVSLAIHAALPGTRWYGTDINPDHAAIARRLAGDGVEIHAESFAEFERRDLPDFDFIGLHGVWSWVSAGNRALIARFIRRRLKPGGVAYLGYNALPGWAAFEPVRHLMTAHAGEPADEDDARRRIAEAMGYVRELLATCPDFTREHPESGRRFANLQGKDWRYLAHEFFNRDWQAMHVADVAKVLAPAGLRFAASADPLDAIEALQLTPAQSALAHAGNDPLFFETVRDFVVNRLFRRDYWVKEPRPLPPRERDEALRSEHVVLEGPRADLPPSLRPVLALNGIGPGDAAIARLLDALGGHRPRSLADLHDVAQSADFEKTLQAVTLLRGYARLAVALPESEAVLARPDADRLNARLLGLATEGRGAIVLASPVTGGGIEVSRLHQLFLRSRLDGGRMPADWAHDALAILAREPTAGDGRAMSAAELETLATAFAQSELPILEALMIA